MPSPVTTPHVAMLAAHGSGPSGSTCQSCVHLLRVRRSHTHRGTVIARAQCRQAPSRANDHGEIIRKPWRVSWSACGKYRAIEV